MYFAVPPPLPEFFFFTLFLFVFKIIRKSHDGAVGIAAGCELAEESGSPERAKNFHLSIFSRPPLGPNHPSIQWVARAYSPEVNGWIVKLSITSN
jgi:hypothetical protein